MNNDHPKRVYHSYVGRPFPESAWCKFAHDGIWVNYRSVEPNWTTEPGKYKFGSETEEEEYRPVMLEFIKEQAAAGDPDYQQLQAWMVAQLLTNE